MQNWLLEHFQWLMAGHIISFVAWMAGMFYLPRLFVYHAGAAPGSELSETLKIMERRLLRAIINPAMTATLIFGVAMLYAMPHLLQEGWMHVKLTFAVILFALHGVLSKARKRFAADQNIKSAKYYRVINEIPTLCLVVIVIMVIVKPF